MHVAHAGNSAFLTYVHVRQIGCHHAWADSPVKVLSEVGFHGSVGSACLGGGTRSHTCINLYTLVNYLYHAWLLARGGIR